MEKVLIVCEEFIPESYLGLMGIVKEYFEGCGLAAEIFCIEADMDPSVCQKKFSEAGLKYICTLDMAGFQIDTTLGGPRYNIVHAKQIHIVINEESFIRYREEDFALNLFMYMPDTMRNDFETRVNMFNMNFYQSFELKKNSVSDRRKLIGILETVRKECEMTCG